jgi:hypothetical protein
MSRFYAQPIPASRQLTRILTNHVQYMLAFMLANLYRATHFMTLKRKISAALTTFIPLRRPIGDLRVDVLHG